MIFEVVRGVFGHDDRLIDENADRDRDPRQRHDVGLDVDDPQLPQDPHHEKREQHGQRQSHADHEHAAEVHQDQKNGDRGDRHFMPHHLGQRVNGPLDEPRAVVRGDNVHSCGQPRLQLLNFLFDALRDVERVLLVPHQHDAPHDFVAVFFVHAAAELRPELDGSHRLYVDRRPLHFFDDRHFDVVFAADPAHAADDVFGVVLLDDPAAGRHIALGDGRIQVAQRDAVGPQRLGAHVDLVFERRAADRSHIGNAGGGVQLRGDVELIEGPQPRRVDRVRGARLDGVPEDLSEGRGVGGQIGEDSRREERPRLGQLFGDALAGEIEVDGILEDDRDHREIEFGGRANGADAGQPLQFARQRISHLVFDLAGRAPHPVGEDDHLVFRQVGNGVHRRIQHRVDACHRQCRRDDQHQEPVANRRFNQFFNHAFTISLFHLAARRSRVLAPVDFGIGISDF